MTRRRRLGQIVGVAFASVLVGSCAINEFVRVGNRGLVEHWIRGRPPSRPATAIAQSEPVTGTVVYITRTGRKYHRSTCQYVRNGGSEAPLAEARRRGLSPCSRCQPPTE